MRLEDYRSLLTVPRQAWDPTEQPHPRQGERRDRIATTVLNRLNLKQR